jgi:hypothetical protein
MVKFCWGQQGPGGENFSGNFLKENEILQKIGSPGMEGKMYTVGLVLGFWTKNGVSFLEIIRSRFLPAIGCL